MISRRFLACLTAVAGIFLIGTTRLSAAESSIRVEAILVWATNVEKPNDANLKELEPALAKKFHKAYKWKYYYQVKSRKEATISDKETDVDISDKCALKIKHLGQERVEVKLIGKGKLVSRSVESLSSGYMMIIAGEDKNDTAWFVVVRQISPKK